MGLIEIAGSVLSRAMQRVEISAQNMANMTTPGYRARRAFPDFLDTDPQSHFFSSSAQDAAASTIDFSAGKMQSTGNPFDLAISGAGFFVVRSDTGTFYTRNGQFSRAEDGRLITAGGLALQSYSGDIVVNSSDVSILSDGTVLEAGQPIARLAIADFSDLQMLQPVGSGLFAAPNAVAQDVENAQIRQKMLETSNVSTADEMLSVMASLRSAETGQHLVQFYDDLMGRAITSFGQAE